MIMFPGRDDSTHNHFIVPLNLCLHSAFHYCHHQPDHSSSKTERQWCSQIFFSGKLLCRRPLKFGFQCAPLSFCLPEIKMFQRNVGVGHFPDHEPAMRTVLHAPYCCCAVGHGMQRYENSATGTRTRAARVRAEYPNQLDYGGHIGDQRKNKLEQ